MEVKSESEVAQSCPTLCDPMDCSLPGSSIHGIFQARVLEWDAVAFSGVQSWNLANPSFQDEILPFEMSIVYFVVSLIYSFKSVNEQRGKGHSGK